MDHAQSGTLAEVAERRAGYRVHAALPVQIRGLDSKGKPYCMVALSEVITRDGGLIVASVSLATGAHVTMARGNKEAEAKVVALVRFLDESNAYGIRFLGDAPSFWGIQAWDGKPEPPAGRVILQCSECKISSVVELGEVDMVVMECVPVLGHFCTNCNTKTLWEPPQSLTDELLVTGSAVFSMPTRRQHQQQEMLKQIRPGGTREQRRFRRVALQRVRACIRSVGRTEDVTSVMDFSRGGLRFTSTVDYQAGERVEVAVPFTPGAGNIFVWAKVVRVLLRARGDLPGVYACEYLNKQ